MNITIITNHKAVCSRLLLKFTYPSAICNVVEDVMASDYCVGFGRLHVISQTTPIKTTGLPD